MTCQHEDLTFQHKDLTRRHKDLTSQQNYLTSDGRNMSPKHNSSTNDYFLQGTFYKGDTFRRSHAFWGYLVICFTYYSIHNLVRTFMSAAAINQHFIYIYDKPPRWISLYSVRFACGISGIRFPVATDLSH